jgi:signal transduction histidine kinase
VGVAQTGGRASIRVHNTGSYIAPDAMKRLFVPFYTTRPTGTGLGLAIARQIVTGAGGRIDADSDPVTGTVFTIELPTEGSGTAGRFPDPHDSQTLTTTPY